MGPIVKFTDLTVKNKATLAAKTIENNTEIKNKPNTKASEALSGTPQEVGDKIELQNGAKVTHDENGNTITTIKDPKTNETTTTITNSEFKTSKTVVSREDGTKKSEVRKNDNELEAEIDYSSDGKTILAEKQYEKGKLTYAQEAPKKIPTQRGTEAETVVDQKWLDPNGKIKTVARSYTDRSIGNLATKDDYNPDGSYTRTELNRLRAPQEHTNGQEFILKATELKYDADNNLILPKT